MPGSKQRKNSSGSDAGQAALPRTPVARLLHDLNQPLSAINSYAQAGIHLIDNHMADEARLKELFSKIAAQSVRATALSQEMSTTLGREEQQS